MSVFETEESGSSPGGATTMSRGVRATQAALNGKSPGSNPGETTKKYKHYEFH